MKLSVCSDLMPQLTSLSLRRMFSFALFSKLVMHSRFLSDAPKAMEYGALPIDARSLRWNVELWPTLLCGKRSFQLCNMPCSLLGSSLHSLLDFKLLFRLPFTSSFGLGLGLFNGDCAAKCARRRYQK